MLIFLHEYSLDVQGSCERVRLLLERPVGGEACVADQPSAGRCTSVVPSYVVELLVYQFHKAGVVISAFEGVG